MVIGTGATVVRNPVMLFAITIIVTGSVLNVIGDGLPVKTIQPRFVQLLKNRLAKKLSKFDATAIIGDAKFVNSV